MIRIGTEMEREFRANMRGGNGTVEILHVFGEEELAGRVRLFAKLTLQPGTSIGFHTHDHEAEAFYIIAGRGMADDNGTRREVQCGDAILTGNGAGHSIEAIGDTALEIMAVIVKFG